MSAFRINPEGLNLQPVERANDRVSIRTSARTLDGMQKEAIIQCGSTSSVWRLICDEGPWLNGTDLAPFPLAFFTAGVAASLMSEFLAEAKDRNIRVDGLNLVQDNFFTMEGSALRGTMTAGAQPMQVNISASGSGSGTDFENIAQTAMHHRSAAECCLREALKSSFAVHANDEELVCLDTGEPSDKSIQLVRMAEQTCYIHAAFNTAVASNIKTGPLPTIV